MVNVVSLTPKDYEIIRENPLYKSQFGGNVRSNAREFVALMIGGLMEDFVNALTVKPFEDGDEDAFECSLSVMEPEIRAMLGRMMVDSGNFDDLVDLTQEAVRGGKNLEKFYPEIEQRLPSLKVDF